MVGVSAGVMVRVSAELEYNKKTAVNDDRVSEGIILISPSGVT